MKKLMSWILGLALAISLCACGNQGNGNESNTDNEGNTLGNSIPGKADNTVPKKDASIKEGNSFGNLINGYGQTADCGDWIIMNWIGVAKIKPDGTGQAKLFGSSAYYMNVVGDTIYYLKESYGTNDVYKIKTDGTGETKIEGIQASWIYVYGDTLYYTYGSALSKIGLDGSGKTVMIPENVTMSCNIGENGVYFIDANYKPWQADADGSNVRRLGEETASKMVLSGERLYFLNPGRGSSVWSMKTDGSDQKQVVSAECAELIVDSGTVYYITSQDKKLYSIKADGSGEAALLYGNEEISGISLAGDIVIGTGNMKCIFVKKDGSGIKIVEREY